MVYEFKYLGSDGSGGKPQAEEGESMMSGLRYLWRIRALFIDVKV